MRLIVSKSKNTCIYYVGESVRSGNKVSTRVIEKIGSHSELKDRDIQDPLQYAKDYVARVNEDLKDNILSYSERIDLEDELVPVSLISEPVCKNIGWLFLLKIYNQLGMKDFFSSLTTKAKYDIDAIVKFLSISRIMNPCSKKATFESIDKYLFAQKYNLIDSYRALELLSKNNSSLQKALFEGSKKITSIDTDVLYYDCTNYYFESEEEDDDSYAEDGDIIQWGLRKYGFSKEHRPNPIVEMGLFVDKNGTPISYSIHPGNTNEQTTAIPLEREMINNYRRSSFIYCSDAGLGSYDIRFFNSLYGRHYLVTQSLKKIDEENSKLMFKDLNWKFADDDAKVSLEAFKAAIDRKISGEELSEKEKSLLKHDMVYKAYPITREVPGNFVKGLGIKISGKLEMEEVIYITFSQKYYIYQKSLFNRQLESALGFVDCNKDIDKKRNTDPARFVTANKITKEGEIAERRVNSLNEEAIYKEEKYHGFYALATNLDKGINELLDINAQRWRIEQSFRIMKTDFDSRPAFVWNEEHIRGHFAICYIALLLFRLLERKLIACDPNYSFSSNAIIKTLNNINVIEKNETIYQSVYTGSYILDALDKTFDISLNKKHYRLKCLIDLFDNRKNYA